MESVSATTARHTLRDRSINILITVAAFVLAGSIGECGLREFAPLHLVGIKEAYEYDPDYGTRLKPGIHIYQTTDHQEEIRTGPLGTVGFHDSFQGYPKRIFTLGDSYTQGTGLPTDASYPAQLDLQLNRDADGLYARKFAVINLGLAAFGGEQSLLALRNFSRDIGRPDYVFYLGSDNDAEDDALFESGERHRSLVEGNPRYGRWRGPLEWLADFEISKRARLFFAGLRRDRSRAAARSSNNPESGGMTVAELERSVLERLRASCDEMGAKLVVSWANHSSSYGWTRKWAADKGVAFADWWPAVESVRMAAPEMPLFNDHSGGHMRTWANGLIAEAYERAMSGAGSPPGVPQPTAPSEPR
jgi:hypothetical protein